MVDSLSDILGDYENKSIGELGDSLLQRQSDQRAAQRKSDKKSAKIGQALAVLGVGQKIFKDAYGKRKDELDSRESFLLSNQDSQVKELQMVGRIVENMPDMKFHEKYKDKTTKEKTKIYLENGQGQGLYKKFTPVIDSLIKQGNNFDDNQFNLFKNNQRGAYNNIYESAMHELVEDYFEVGEDGSTPKYFGFEKEMRGLFSLPDSMDRLDVFKKAMNMSVNDLSKAERKWISDKKSEYSNRGFFNTVKDGLKQVGLKNQEKGGINIFKNIDSVNLEGAGLDDVLADLRVNGSLISATDLTLANHNSSNIMAKNNYLADEQAQNNVELYLQDFDKQFYGGQGTQISRYLGATKRNYDSDNRFKLAIDRRGDWSGFTNDINKTDNPVMYAQWKEDIGVLAKLFQDDSQLAEQAYFRALDTQGIKYTDADVKRFKVNINNNSFRHSIAIAMTAREGFTKSGDGYFSRGFRGEESYDMSTMDKIETKYLYDRDAGTIPEVLGEGITYNEKQGKYSGTSYYNKQTVEAQTRMYSNEINKIFNSKITDTEKNLAMEHLFETLENPLGISPVDFLAEFPPIKF